MKDEKPVRIQKMIADRGLASRREAEQWIEEGRVTVNGNLASIGDTCLPGRDVLAIDGVSLPKRQPRRVVVAMNKPKGYVCTSADRHASRTVFDLLPPELREMRLSCVGRLDKDSEGLLILTNDGELQQQLAHPSYHVVKKYEVDTDKPLREPDVRRLIRGITWEGEHLSIDKVYPRQGRGGENWRRLEVTLHHGKKREIRRLFYAFGYEVLRLRRIRIGQLDLKGLPSGHIRTLLPSEIKRLFASPD